MSFRYLGLMLLLVAVIFSSAVPPAQADLSDVCTLLDGASIITQDSENEFLGKIASSFDSKSIFNDYGTYGNDFSSKSIWNEYSKYGNEFNSYSPFNEFSSHPPMLIKKGDIIGYLSTNKAIKGSISPKLLKAL